MERPKLDDPLGPRRAGRACGIQRVRRGCAQFNAKVDEHRQIALLRSREKRRGAHRKARSLGQDLPFDQARRNC